MKNKLANSPVPLGKRSFKVAGLSLANACKYFRCFLVKEKNTTKIKRIIELDCCVFCSGICSNCVCTPRLSFSRSLSCHHFGSVLALSICSRNQSIDIELKKWAGWPRGSKDHDR